MKTSVLSLKSFALKHDPDWLSFSIQKMRCRRNHEGQLQTDLCSAGWNPMSHLNANDTSNTKKLLLFVFVSTIYSIQFNDKKYEWTWISNKKLHEMKTKHIETWWLESKKWLFKSSPTQNQGIVSSTTSPLYFYTQSSNNWVFEHWNFYNSMCFNISLNSCEVNARTELTNKSYKLWKLYMC